MIYGTAMNDERYNDWIRASHAVGGIDHYRAFMCSTIQGLARLDCQLIAADEQFLLLTEQQRATIPVSVELTERITLSYLWVIGAYEIVRTLDQRSHETSVTASPSMSKHIKSVKRLFERVRIPLAKFETSRRNPNDNPVAYPAINPSHGVAWLITDNTFVSRRQLSDALFTLLIELRALRNNKQ